MSSKNYMPPKKPTIITVLEMNFPAVRGQGNLNDENGTYKQVFTLNFKNKYT